MPVKAYTFSNSSDATLLQKPEIRLSSLFRTSVCSPGQIPPIKRSRFLTSFFGGTDFPGALSPRNKALREARGRWIAFLDSDDLWHPEKLERQLAFMKENDYAFTFTDYRIQLNGEWLLRFDEVLY